MKLKNINSDKPDLWMNEHIYRQAFIKKHLNQILRRCLNACVIAGVIFICSRPLIQSQATNNENDELRIMNYELDDGLVMNYDADDIVTAGEAEEREEDYTAPAIEFENEIEGIEIETQPEEDIPVLEVLTVPNWITECKSYNITHMDYRAVTDKTSFQHRLLNCSEAYTDELTGLRMINGRYAIAVGLGFKVTVGDYVTVVFTNGSEFECIIGDIKDNRDTDSSKRFQKYDGSVVEAITDRNYFTGSKGYPEGFNGTIDQIVRLDKSYEFDD